MTQKPTRPDNLRSRQRVKGSLVVDQHGKPLRKFCPRCRQWLPIEFFRKRTKNSTSYQSYDTGCYRQYQNSINEKKRMAS